jgi:inosine/xanthosine triphosphatase
MYSPSSSPLGSLERVFVGSKNEPKIAAVRAAVGAFARGVSVTGVAVSSGVSDQPVGFEEIVRGARNRAEAAIAAGDCDLGVGIEDGLVSLPNGVEPGCEAVVNVGCAAVSDGRRVSIGFSSGFAYPPDVAERAVTERAPIGDLFDELWRKRSGERARIPSARTSGNVGKLTSGVLSREEYARHAVLCALVSFLHPDLYPNAADDR